MAPLRTWDDSSDDESGSGSGSDDDESGSGSGSDDDESGSGSGSDDDDEGSGSDDGSDNDDEDKEGGEDGESDDMASAEAIGADIDAIVELCNGMDSIVNRIRNTYVNTMGNPQSGAGNALAGATEDSAGRDGEGENDENLAPGGGNKDGGTPRDTSQLLPGQTTATPNMSRNGSGAVGSEHESGQGSALGSAKGSQPNSRRPSATPDGATPGGLPPSGTATPSRDWDSYSTDSLYEPSPFGRNFHSNDPERAAHDIVTPSDMYKYHEHGVDFGGQANDQKRIDMIQEAIAALMQDDDDN
jgi:hypothetical protein